MSTTATQDGSERDPFTEGSTIRFLATLTDELGVAIAASAITAVEATLSTYPAAATINGRAKQNVRNVNGGTVTDGAFALVLAGADCASQAGESTGVVQRELVVSIDYNRTGGGTGQLNIVHRYYVELFDRLPQV